MSFMSTKAWLVMMNETEIYATNIEEDSWSWDNGDAVVYDELTKIMHE